MYFDSTSFKQSFQTYLKPLVRELQDSYYYVPKAVAKFRDSCRQYWQENKPKSIGGVLSELLFSPILLIALLIAIIWFAIYNPEAKELGWFSLGLWMILYALSVPIAGIILILFNLKFGLPDYPQTEVPD